MGDADDALEGALEEGLEAPPEEELPEPDLLLDADEDLSYASMLAAALDGGASDRLQHGLEGAGGAAAAPPPPSSAAAGGSLFQDFDVSADLAGPTPLRPKPGSIALGGLLAAGTPGSPFGSAPSSSPFGGFGSAGGMPPPQQHQAPLQDAAIMSMGGAAPPPVVASLPGPGPSPLGGPLGGPRPLTAQELEAQLLGGSAGGRQAGPLHGPPGHMPPPPPFHIGIPSPGMLAVQHNGFPHPQPPMGPPPGYGMPPPPGYGPPPGHPGMQGGPPPGQPGPTQGGPPPPPHFSPGAAFPPMAGSRPPPRPIPMQQPGMFAGPPDGQGPPPPPGYGPPPPHMQQQQQQHLSGGPRPPPHGFPPHVRPGPSPRPWGPRPPPGAPHAPHGPHPPRPPHHQPAGAAAPQVTLAQRLRALDLGERQEEVRRRPLLRRRFSSAYMDHEEIEHILAIQWRALHTSSPYLEDYYYQAFLYKYYGRRNRRSFAPESVRELAPTEKVAPDEVAFVRVEGLGRLPFSNIRRPRPLMDVAPEDLRRKEGGEGEEEGEGGAATAAASRRLDQEPALAARIMLEDCMCLLLDVTDIDQIFVAAAGGPVENEGALLTRRSLLMDGLAASLRLPEVPAVPPPTPGGGGGGGEVGDGVFLRLMALPKGKKLLARALRLAYPAPEASQAAAQRAGPAHGHQTALRPNLRVVWAALRSLRFLFGGLPGAEDAAAASAVAAAAAEVLRRLHSADAAADCLAAVLAGDLDGAPRLHDQPDAVLLPLYAPGANAQDAQRPWLADVLVALLQRAAELDLLPAASPGEEAAAAAAAWRAALPRLAALVERHVGALREAFLAGVAMGEAEAAAEVRALVPVSLVRVLLPHCSPDQAGSLRGHLREVGV